MDLTQQVTIWIEKNLGKKISKDLKKLIKEEDSTFDVEAYINYLYFNYFTKNKMEIMKKNFFENSNDMFKSYDSDNSSQVDYLSQELFEFEPNEFQSFTGEEIFKLLKNNSREVRIKCLRQLGFYGEDLISHTSWNLIKNLLQNFLKTNNDREISILTLKVFLRLLFCYNKPQIVCESFTCISEMFYFHFELVNSDNVAFEEIYDLKTNKLLNVTGSKRLCQYDESKLQKHFNAEMSIKLLFLLIECQKQMPEKWIRFNEKRLRKIIFNFINVLSSTTNLERENLSGLELLSVLSPTANWCRHWCHTSMGRLLFCTALRKYKNFFIYIIRNIISNIQTRKTHNLQTKTSDKNFKRFPSANNEFRKFTYDKSSNKLEKMNYNVNERNKCIHSAPNLPVNSEVSKTKKCKNSEFIIGNIPRKVIEQALFCHNISLITCLIQYKSGRSLFPLQLNSKKRLLSVQDLVLSIINYFEKFESDKIVGVTQIYHQRIWNIVEALKNVQIMLNSRGTSGQRLGVSKR